MLRFLALFTLEEIISNYFLLKYLFTLWILVCLDWAECEDFWWMQCFKYLEFWSFGVDLIKLSSFGLRFHYKCLYWHGFRCNLATPTGWLNFKWLEFHINHFGIHFITFPTFGIDFYYCFWKTSNYLFSKYLHIAILFYYRVPLECAYAGETTCLPRGTAGSV